MGTSEVQDRRWKPDSACPADHITEHMLAFYLTTPFNVAQH